MPQRLRQLPSKGFVPLIAMLTLSGCAQYQWQKYGATQDEFNRDSYQCQMEAARAYPTVAVTEQLTSGYTTPGTTNCNGSGSAYGVGNSIYGTSQTNCITTPARYVAPVTYTRDANSDNRAEAAKSCLVARGYNLVRVK